MRRDASDPATLALPFLSIKPYERSSHLAFCLDLYIGPLIFPLVISLHPNASTFCFATEGIFFQLVFLNLPQVGTEKSCVLKSSCTC
jgi:hypothetical protein